MKFTKRALDGLTPEPGKSRTIFTDDQTPGFRIRVTDKAKTFVVDYRFAGKRKTRTIGKFPTVDLDTARAVALETIRKAAAGEDPEALVVAERGEDTRLTVRGALDIYEREKARKMKSGVEVMRLLHRELDGDAILEEVTGADLRCIMDRKRADGVTQARLNRIAANIRSFFKWCCRYSADGKQPLLKIAPVEFFHHQTKEQARERLLSMEEMQKLFEAAGDLVDGPAARVLMLTGARLSEITKLRPAEVDVSERCIRLAGDRTKNGKPHIIPLSDQAWEIVRDELQNSDGDYVFNHRALNRLKEKLPKLAEDYRVHDFRKAVATHLSSAGVDPITVEFILGHDLNRILNSGVASTYNKDDRVDQRREALQLWANMLSNSNVVAIRRPNTGAA